MIRDRIATKIRDTSALRDKVADPRSSDLTNTTLHKQFFGSNLTLTGINSPLFLRAISCRMILYDEVDRYPPAAGSEGAPVLLAKRRAVFFGTGGLF